MYPHERSLVKQLADQPFALIGVNSDSDLDEIREIVKEKNLTWRSFQDSQEYGDISDRWGIVGWPTVFVLDENGKIRYRDVRGDQLDRAIEGLLAEMGRTVEIIHEEEEEEKPADASDTEEDSKPEAADETKEDRDK